MEENYQPGDIVYALKPIHNDGSVPELEDNALIAKAGARGVIINEGRFEEHPDDMLYLVRFENDDSILGPPVGVWPEELTQLSVV